MEWIQIQQNQTLGTLNTCTGYNWFGVNTDTTKPNVKYIKLGITCTGYNWFGVNTDTTKPNVKYIKYMYWV